MSGLIVDQPKGVMRTGWSATVDDYAISGGWADKGNILIVGDAAGGIFGFEGKSGKVKWNESDVHGNGLLCMDIHPSGEIFATGGQDGRVLICSASTGEVKKTLEHGRGWVENVSWSPDGQWLAISISRRVHVYNVYGHEVWQSDSHVSTVSAIAWAGKEEIASACYGCVTIFEVYSGEIFQQFEWKGSLVSMVLSPNGDVVACGSQDNSVHFWRRSTGQDSMMQGYPTKPSTLAFDNTGTLLATSGSEAVTVWSFHDNGPEGTAPGILELHVQPITALSFARNAMKLASGARDGAVVLWSLKVDGNGGIVGAALVGEPISKLMWRPDDRAIAALDAKGGVNVWRVSS